MPAKEKNLDKNPSNHTLLDRCMLANPTIVHLPDGRQVIKVCPRELGDEVKDKPKAFESTLKKKNAKGGKRNEKDERENRGCAVANRTHGIGGLSLSDGGRWLHSIEIVFVEGGSFQMGSTDSDAYPHESPVHEVTVSSFYMAKTEVTVREFREFVQLTGYKLTCINKKIYLQESPPLLYCF